MKIIYIYILIIIALVLAGCSFDNLYGTIFGYKVKYEVLGLNERVNISYSYDDENLVEIFDVNLPWSYEFKTTFNNVGYDLYIFAEKMKNTGHNINTRIYINDTLVDDDTSKYWSSASYKLVD